MRAYGHRREPMLGLGCAAPGRVAPLDDLSTTFESYIGQRAVRDGKLGRGRGLARGETCQFPGGGLIPV